MKQITGKIFFKRFKYIGEGRFETKMNGFMTNAHWTHFVQQFIKKIIAPVFCKLCGHTWRDHFMGHYVCEVCNKDY